VSALTGGRTMGRADGQTPVRSRCEVMARKRDGAYYRLSFSAREIAERARPGQFVQVDVQAPHTLLRRPFSIAGVSRQGPGAGTVEIVFDAHGPGTEWLTSVSVHDVLDVIGPLGTAFPLPQRKVNCLLVGGGYGVAPLFYLGEHLLRRGLRVDMIAGAATGDRLLGIIEAKRLSASSTFTTEDGSYGVRGRVTDVLTDVASATKASVVYACGPNPMLRAVSEACQQLELPVQVAVEELMACGIGVCFTCVLPMRGRSDGVRMKRTCLEGPVFNGARIAWDQSRYAVGPGTRDGAEQDPAGDDRPTDAELWGEADGPTDQKRSGEEGGPADGKRWPEGDGPTDGKRWREGDGPTDGKRWREGDGPTDGKRHEEDGPTDEKRWGQA
jgi:dihydroorotate dehydrogenase electron transfer subunit